MEIRKASPEDIAGIVELQDRYVRSRVGEDNAAAGFLSNRFSGEQFAAINEQLAVVVAITEQKGVVAFLCGTDIESMGGNAIVAAMIAANESSMSPEATCLAGPVCIDESQRGKGLMSKLYDYLGDYARANTTFTQMAVFISPLNTASLKAHEKIGFVVTNPFEHAGQNFLTLVKSSSGSQV